MTGFRPMTQEQWNKEREESHVFEVKMLKRIKGSNVAAGKKAYASKQHDGIYLSANGRVGEINGLGKIFETNAIEGIDFVRS